jgi:hypothetical protein
MTHTATVGTVETVTAPYIHEQEIDVRTWNQLVQVFPNGIPVPIPIEDIVERYYRIPLEFEEMDREILGYFDFRQKKIWVNSSLEADYENERLRFTIAHELGHCCIHSRYANEGGVLFSKGMEFYKHNHSRLERQANLFAGYFLMPSDLVLGEWIKLTGSKDPYSLEDENKRYKEHQRENDYEDIIDFNFEFESLRFIQDIAKTFEVSWTCAKIQLERLRLLY